MNPDTSNGWEYTDGIEYQWTEITMFGSGNIWIDRRQWPMVHDVGER